MWHLVVLVTSVVYPIIKTNSRRRIGNKDVLVVERTKLEWFILYPAEEIHTAAVILTQIVRTYTSALCILANQQFIV